MWIFAVQLAALALLLTLSYYADELQEMMTMDYPLMPSTLHSPEGAIVCPTPAESSEAGKNMVKPQPYNITPHKSISSPQKPAKRVISVDIPDEHCEGIIASDGDAQEISSIFKTSSSNSDGLVATAVPVITPSTHMAHIEPPPRSGYTPAAAQEQRALIYYPSVNHFGNDWDPPALWQAPRFGNDPNPPVEQFAPPATNPMWMALKPTAPSLAPSINYTSKVTPEVISAAVAVSTPARNIASEHGVYKLSAAMEASPDSDDGQQGQRMGELLPALPTRLEEISSSTRI